MGRTTVEVHVLGGFDVIVDGAPATDSWASRRAAELVQLLAIAPGHQLMRDEVIDALWPHLPADAGGANLRKAAHHARRILGDARALVLQRQQVSLYPDAKVQSDYAAFVAAADSAIEAGDTTLAARVASMYAGPLLPSARYEAWAETSRRLAADRYLDVLRIAGRWDLVIEQDPTDEAAYREMMQVALGHGHRHRAIALYGRLRKSLRDELGVAPAEETEELYQMCCAGLITTKRAIIGRDRELATIDALLADQELRSDLLVVCGPAGIGKTTFVRELAERASDAGWVTARVSADDPNDAYATLAALQEQLVENRRGIVEALDARTRSVLAMVVVSLTGHVAPLDLPLTRHQMVGATQRLVEAVGAERGVVLIVDDLDRCDESSLQVLSLLGDRRSGQFILAVTSRDLRTNPSVAPAIARASRNHRPLTFALDPLDAHDVETLARQVAPAIDAARLATVSVLSDGVPLFVVELAGARTDEPLDDTIRVAIEARVVDLPEHEVAWLRRLGIVGGLLDLEAVVALTGCDDDDTDQFLDHALHAGVLIVEDVGYRFRHELVRTVLAKQVPPHQQAAVHRDAARRLAQLGARPGRIAGHWVDGHRPAEAAEWFTRAADDAIRLGGYTAAVEFSDLALGNAIDHPRALRQRAAALDALGDARALATYDAAISVATPDEIQELRPLQALAQIKMGDPDGALLTVAGATPQTLESQLAHALTMSGAALLGAIGPEEGTRLSAATRRRSLRAGDPAAVVVAAWAQSAVAHARGELRESLQIDLADTSALPRLAVTVFDGQLCITQRLLYGSRPYDDVIDFTNNFAAEAQRLGASRGFAFATTLRGEAELLSGHLAPAERDLREGARLHHEIAAATGESFSYQRLSELAHIHGERELARQLIDTSLDIARSSDVGFHLFDRIYGTKIRLAADPSEALEAVIEAEESVRGPFETCPGCRITLDVPAAIASARAGDLERLERYEQSSTWLADIVMRLPAWNAAIEEVRAHRHLAHGDVRSAADLFERAAASFAHAGHPIDAQRCATFCAN